jgi:hypothetical protein
MKSVAWFVLFGACGLKERPDFLIGRQCAQEADPSCDEGQKCLPHSIGSSGFGNFRCRDRESFELVDGQEPPPAYCDDDNPCPGDLVCNADRIREDSGRRPLVCKRPDDVFNPPLEGQ